eukprot:TRINITY_DN2382_c0_g2_i1.p1 TRINITY_DN2382_c0_g2~~TRINITY_DN2382_c0_g2_i1.p1  ORF type:complete len:636 (-),score=266.84 TRINITY_DN2382_c0_g2_i1:40-1947(-)
MAETSKITNDVMDLQKNFSDFHLDLRLLQGIASLNWKNPSLVQSNAIPLILNGKDVMAKARTGSGKTGAFAIPLLQMILSQKEKTGIQRATSVFGLILVPTRELCEQTKECLDELKQFFKGFATVYSVHGDNSISEQKAQLRNIPDIIVSTPTRLYELIQKNSISLESLKLFILDESDLLLSYGYLQDLQNIVKLIPKTCQSLLFSATLGAEVENLKSLVLHTPAVLKLSEKVNSKQLKEYYLETDAKDRFLVLYTLIRLKVVPGKALIFCNSVYSAFELQLYLRKFCISSIVLNSQLPHNSRIRIIKEFNKGMFDFLIATEESFIEEDSSESDLKMKKIEEAIKKEDEMDEDEDEKDEEEEEMEEEEKEVTNIESDSENDEEEVDLSKVKEEEGEEQKSKKKPLKMTKGSEAGVTRGIDFKEVDTVINFDFPAQVNSYVHRVGRTARGSAQGIALSFVVNNNKRQQRIFEKLQETKRDEGLEIQPYKLNLSVLEGFRYRSESVLQTIDKKNIHQARIDELKKEIMSSAQLKGYFESHQDEKNLLNQSKGKPKSNAPLQHLKVLPEYLVPSSVQSQISGTVDRRIQQKKQRQNQKRSRDKFDEFLEADPEVAIRSEGYYTKQARSRGRDRKKGKK